MGVFHVFKIVQMILNRAMHHPSNTVLICLNGQHFIVVGDFAPKSSNARVTWNKSFFCEAVVPWVYLFLVFLGHQDNIFKGTSEIRR